MMQAYIDLFIVFFEDPIISSLGQTLFCYQILFYKTRVDATQITGFR